MQIAERYCPPRPQVWAAQRGYQVPDAEPHQKTGDLASWQLRALASHDVGEQLHLHSLDGLIVAQRELVAPRHQPQLAGRLSRQGATTDMLCEGPGKAEGAQKHCGAARPTLPIARMARH